MSSRHARGRHLRRQRLLRRAVVPLLLAGTAVAVTATVTGGTTTLRVAALLVLALGVGAALAAEADARAERRELLAQHDRLWTAATAARDRLTQAHQAALAAVHTGYTARIDRLSDHLTAADAQVLAARRDLAGLRAELSTVRAELERMTRSRNALRADVQAYVQLETARLTDAEREVPESVVALGSWERRAG